MLKKILKAEILLKIKNSSIIVVIKFVYII